jgi:hypothetical protein
VTTDAVYLNLRLFRFRRAGNFVHHRQLEHCGLLLV